jgi:hypothetical protein
MCGCNIFNARHPADSSFRKVNICIIVFFACDQKWSFCALGQFCWMSWNLWLFKFILLSGNLTKFKFHPFFKLPNYKKNDLHKILSSKKN